jgi:hypothetical protein
VFPSAWCFSPHSRNMFLTGIPIAASEKSNVTGGFGSDVCVSWSRSAGDLGGFRVEPCTHCIRLNLDCRFPTRKKNQRRRPKRQDELLGRLARLEQIVGRVDASTALSPDDTAPAPSEVDSIQGESHDILGLPTRGRGESDLSIRYLSRDFWANLCQEVEGLKQALEQPSEDSDDDHQRDEGSTPGSNLSSSHTVALDSPVSHTAMLGNSSSIGSDTLVHPTAEQISFLCSTYFRNVDPVFKPLHRPSTVAAMESFSRSRDSRNIDRATEALFFAIYFAAVTPLSPEACRTHLHEERDVVLNRYRLATEVALARADYLNSSQLEPLQALSIYIVSTKEYDAARAAHSWRHATPRAHSPISGLPSL